MNCQAGDLCCVVRLPLPAAFDDLLGRFVTVVALKYFDGVPIWTLDKREQIVLRRGVENVTTGEIQDCGSHGFVDDIPDEFLQPIRGVRGGDSVLRQAPIASTAQGVSA